MYISKLLDFWILRSNISKLIFFDTVSKLYFTMGIKYQQTLFSILKQNHQNLQRLDSRDGIKLAYVKHIQDTVLQLTSLKMSRAGF